MAGRAFALFGALLATGALVAGCGGSSNDSSTSSLSKAEWIAKADALCKAGDAADNQKIQQIPGSHKGEPSPSQLQQIAQILGTGTKDEVSKIRDLGAPQGDESTVNSFLDAAESGADQIMSNPEQLKTNGNAPNADLAKADSEAKAYGLKVCGQD